MSTKQLAERYTELSELPESPQRIATAALNLVPAPCPPCADKQLAACAIDPPQGCENLSELVLRAVSMAARGAALESVREAVNYPEPWWAIDAGSGPTQGLATAVVPVHLWMDLNSPLAREVTTTLDTLQDRHTEDIRVFFHHYPADAEHQPESTLLAHAGQAAHLQGQFWAFYTAWPGTQGSTPERLRQAAAAAKVDIAQFDADRQSEATRVAVAADRAHGEDMGVRTAPTYFISGYRMRGAQSADALSRIIERHRIPNTPE